jgi:hypothetical protein
LWVEEPQGPTDINCHDLQHFHAYNFGTTEKTGRQQLYAKGE